MIIKRCLKNHDIIELKGHSCSISMEMHYHLVIATLSFSKPKQCGGCLMHVLLCLSHGLSALSNNIRQHK